MSADVITLPERKVKVKPAEFPKDTASFCCQSCDGREFRVYLPGDLYCCDCKTMIGNLIVRQK